eukprot:766591-Pleurochrysis_carterae.AAC.2
MRACPVSAQAACRDSAGCATRTCPAAACTPPDRGFANTYPQPLGRAARESAVPAASGARRRPPTRALPMSQPQSWREAPAFAPTA